MDIQCHQDCGPGFEVATRVNKTGTHMRALAYNPDKLGFNNVNKFTIWNNNTLTEMYELTPKGTSCIFIEFKLYSESEGKVPYEHE
jgi:hypothetical protein